MISAHPWPKVASSLKHVLATVLPKCAMDSGLRSILRTINDHNNTSVEKLKKKSALSLASSLVDSVILWVKLAGGKRMLLRLCTVATID
jgi:hypothetical protein